MLNQLRNLTEAEQARISQIGAELARYGLGVMAPHIHGADGSITALPPGMIAMEENLQVSFVQESAVPANAIAVGWRSIGGELVVCAGCCGRT